MKYFMAIIATVGLCLGFVACGDEKEDTAVVEDTAADAGSDAGAGGSDAGEEGEGEEADTGAEAGSEEADAGAEADE